MESTRSSGAYFFSEEAQFTQELRILILEKTSKPYNLYFGNLFRLLPIQLAAAGLPQQRDVALNTFQPDKAIANIKGDLIHLPDDYKRYQGYSSQGWQVKKGIQKVI